MIEIGRLCVKIAGRDAGLKCVIVDILDSNLVLIDGETRRRKSNILHLEPLKEKVKIKKNASHEEIKKVLESLGIQVRETKPKQKTERPRKKRKTSEELKKRRDEKKAQKETLKKDKEKKIVAKGESLEEKAGLVDKKEDKKKPEVPKKKENKIKTVKKEK